MQILITGAGIYGADGEIPVGARLTLEDEPTAWAGRYQILDADAKPAKAAASPSITADDYVPVAPFVAKDTGGNWFTVFDANDKQVGKKLRKADGEAFNGFSDADKAEFLAEYLPKADA